MFVRKDGYCFAGTAEHFDDWLHKLVPGIEVLTAVIIWIIAMLAYEANRIHPLAWAARTNMPDMVEFLLARGAPTHLPDDPAWATPLAWAERRGHEEVAEILRKRGVAR